MNDDRDDVAREARCLPETLRIQIEQRRTGKRGNVRHGGTLCSRCLRNPPASPDRYCAPCRAAYRSAHGKAERRELKRLRALELEQQQNQAG